MLIHFIKCPFFLPRGHLPGSSRPPTRVPALAMGWCSSFYPSPPGAYKKTLAPITMRFGGGQGAWVSYVQTSFVIDGTLAPWPTERGLGRFPSNSRYGTFSRVHVRPELRGCGLSEGSKRLSSNSVTRAPLLQSFVYFRSPRQEASPHYLRRQRQ